MTSSYLSKKPFKSEEFLAASIARSIPTEAALSSVLIFSMVMISFVLVALHFNDSITKMMARKETTAVLFIAFTVALLTWLPGQKLMRNCHKKNKKKSCWISVSKKLSQTERQKQVTHSNTNPWSGQYLTHAHSHITWAVAAKDSCFGLVRPH